MVKAAILAGGQGSRFKPYTDIVPKPMIPVGPEDRPLLEVIVLWLRRHGIRDMIFLVGYKWKYIHSHFRDGAHLGVKIEYSLDDEEYHGTGGALLKAYKQGLLDTDPVLVWYGDILAPLNPQELLKTHRESQAQATLAVTTQYRVPVGIAKLDQKGNIVGLEEKPWLPLQATIGILALNPRLLLQAEQHLGKSFDIMAHLIPWMISQGLQVKAYTYHGPWYDLGSLEKYVKLDHNNIQDMLNPTQQ